MVYQLFKMKTPYQAAQKYIILYFGQFGILF